MLTATGEIRNDDAEQERPGVLPGLAHSGADAVIELAAETSRIFLGIQIQCAQCHDHPSDVWKRQQFHEFAAYFARCRERPIRDEHAASIGADARRRCRSASTACPTRTTPKKGTAVHPKFLDGKGPPATGFDGLSDNERRKALADVDRLARTTPGSPAPSSIASGAS